jgi:hypothetical protein
MSAKEGRRGHVQDAGLAAELGPWRGAGKGERGRPRGGNEAYGALLPGYEELNPRWSARAELGQKPRGEDKSLFFFFSKFPK